MKIIAVGDTILSNNFFEASSYSDLMECFNTGNILTLNLETVVTDADLRAEDKAVCFKTPENNLKRFAKDLKNRPICNIANNHVFDFGKDGYESTKKCLEKYHVSYVGEKDIIHIAEVDGKKIAFIGGYESKLKELNTINEELLQLIRQISCKVDYCIVHIHWGRELSIGISELQKEWAHKIIDAGCDVIIGHHPHVLQGIEKYNDRYIFYSLGNFQIPINPYEKLSTISIVLELIIDEAGLISYQYIPVRLDDYGVPAIGNKYDYEVVNRVLKEGSDEIIKFTKMRYYLNFSSIYIKESVRAWKMRIGKHEKNIYKSIFKWLCSGMVIKAFCFMTMDKLTGYTKKRNSRIWNGKND